MASYKEQGIDIITELTGIKNKSIAKVVHEYIRTNFTDDERDFTTLQLLKKKKVQEQLKEIAYKYVGKHEDEGRAILVLDVIRKVLGE